MSKRDVILVIGDLHCPYEHPDTVKFLRAIKEEYSPTRVVQMGDECFPGDAEVLTPNGWTKFQDLPGNTPVMQYNETGTGEFVVPLRSITREYSGEMVTRQHSNYYSNTTAGHNIVLLSADGVRFTKIPADSEEYKHLYLPRFLNYSGSGIPLSDAQIRLQVMVSADFSLRASGDVYGALKKERKIARAKELLTSLGLRYTTNVDSRGYTTFFIHRGQGLDFLSKEFNNKWVVDTTLDQRRILLTELGYWDGYIDPTRTRVIYCSSLDHNIQFVQTLAHTSGLEASVREVSSEFGKSKQVALLWGKRGTRNNPDITKTLVEGLKVYCVTVPSGMLLVKQNGTITVTGNCDMHSISFHTKDPDLAAPKDELKRARDHLSPLYKLFPKVELIESNHGSLIYRKAMDAGIPSEAIKGYREILKAPKGWAWHFSLTLKTALGKIFFHHGKSSRVGALSQNMAMSAVQGHYHSKFYIYYWASPMGLYWDMNVGCLADDSSRAMGYGKNNLPRSIVGAGIIKNGVPQLIPMVLNKNGKWVGDL